MKRFLNPLIFSLIMGLLLTGNIYSEVVEVTDCIGRKVKIDNSKLRIAALFAVAGHTVAMLEGGDKIVAVSRGLVRDKMFNMLLPHIKDLPVPKAGGGIKIEELLRAEPNLLLVDRSVAVNSSETERFKKFGLKWLTVEIRSIKSQFHVVRMLGKILGKEDLAKKYIDFYSNSIKLVQKRTSALPVGKKARVFHSNNEPTHTDAPDSVPAEWIKAAGMVNVSAEGKLTFTDNKYYAGMEQILQWNPDVIIVNEDGKGEFIKKSPQWKNIEAVRRNRVYLLPNGISRWGHTNSIETPLAIIWTACKVYPDLFKDINIRSEVRGFYKKFFRMDIDDKLLNRILKGKGMRDPKKKRRRNR